MDSSSPAVPAPGEPLFLTAAQLEAVELAHQQRQQELLTTAQAELARKDAEHKATLQQQEQEILMRLEATAQAELARKDQAHNANLQQQFHVLSDQFQAQWAEREARLREEQTAREQEYAARLQALENQLRASSSTSQNAPAPSTVNQQPPSMALQRVKGRSHQAGTRQTPSHTRQSAATNRPAASRTSTPTNSRTASPSTTRPLTPLRRPYKSKQSVRSKKKAPLPTQTRLRSDQPAGEDDDMGTGTQSGGGASGVEFEGDVDDEVDDEDEDEEEDEEQKKKKQKKRQAFQLKTMDLPKDIKGIKDALMLHIRILWRLLDSRVIPRRPLSTMLEQFDQRFTTEAAIHVQTCLNNLLIAVSQVRGASFLVRSTLPPAEDTDAQKQRSKIYNTVRKMEDHILQYIDVVLARFGFEEWCPDLTQSPYSLYNSACRIVALDTFKQAAASHAYAQLKPNLVYLHDLPLLTRIYDHFIFYYFQERFNRDLKNPGIISTLDDTNTLYHNRSRLAEARFNWLVENGYPERYQDLISAKATSDDERDPAGSKINGRQVHFIKKRPERSAAATRFFRLLDKFREADARSDPKRRWKERVRRDPPFGHPSETAFPAIPMGMPIDYFDPNFFNHLQPRLRALAAKDQVALLPDVEMSFTRCADERISDTAFTRKYRNEVFGKYDLVNAADLLPPEDSDLDEGAQSNGEIEDDIENEVEDNDEDI